MSTMPTRRNRLRTALDAERDMYSARGADATSQYEQYAGSFDPQAAINQYATGAWNGIAGELRKTLADTRGRSVGAGRFDTGFLDEDQGEIIENTANNFQNVLAQQAVTAAGMQQRNMEGLGAYGERQAERGTGMRQADWEQEENDRREEDERKRRRKRGIGSAIGGLVGAAGGFVLGGPAGAAGGYKAWSAIGGSF